MFVIVGAALLAGGIATAADTRAALARGAGGVVSGTRFLLTPQRRIPTADKTFRTTLFELAWPAPHRVVANAATRHLCHEDGSAKLAPRLINAGSGLLAKLSGRVTAHVVGLQASRLPLFSPVAPTVDMPESSMERAALYAGETVLRLTTVISARQAVADRTAG